MTDIKVLDILKALPFYTKANLSLALGKEGENLNYWLKKLSREGLLTPLKKGFYISPTYPDQSENYWINIANNLRFPSYVSLEYALAKYNLIPEAVFGITCITSKSSRIYTTPQVKFIYRNIKQNLFYGYQTPLRIAYPAKALFDFLYLKEFTSDAQMREYLLESGRINWENLDKDQKTKFTQAVQDSKSTKMTKVIKMLNKAKII